MSERDKAKARASHRLKKKLSFSEQLSQEQLDFLRNYDGPITIGPTDKRFMCKETDMSEREVKLTAREPTTEQDGEISSGLPQKYVGNHPWIVGHDAAPDDATEALERILRRASYYKQFQDDFADLRATDAGAALIRQAMERDGST